MTAPVIGIPLALLAAAGAGWVACRAAGWNPHGREMLLAGLVALLATFAGLAPGLLARRSDPATRAQAALAGSVAQMLLMIFLAFAVVVLNLAPARQALIGWLLLFYWASLAILVWALVRLIRERC